MAILRTRPKTSGLQPARARNTLVESPTLESLSENQQTPSCITVDLPSGGVPSKAPSALESLCKDQLAPEGPSEDRRPAEHPAKDLPAGEVSKDLPAVASPSEDQPTTEGPSKDPKPAEDLTVTLPAREAPSKPLPTKEPSTTPPQLSLFKDPPSTKGRSEDPKPAEDPIATPPAEEAPSKAPAPRESSTTPPQPKSPSEGQPTTEVQAGDRQTAEGPTTDQQVEKAPEDTPASESLPNGQSTTECPTTNLPEGEIPKEPTESSSQGESTVERPSEDLATEDLPITPTAKALPSSRKLSDAPMANSDQEHQKDFPSNPPSSDTVKETSQRNNREAEGQKPKVVNSRKRVRVLTKRTEVKENFSVIYLDSDGEDVEILASQPTHVSFKPSANTRELNGERMPRKRPKYDTEDTNLPAPTLLNSPKGSTTASEDEPNSRRKPNPRPRVTRRELNDYVAIEKGWLDPSLSRCRKIRQNFATQNHYMTLLETLNTQIYQIVGQISADSVPRKRRLELGEELKTLEKERRGLTAKLRQAVCDVTIEAASMEQDLEQWQAKENKFTNRIEKSR